MQTMTSVEVETMMANTLIGRLSMVDQDGRPYTIPLPFCWSNAAIYVRLPLTGRKGEILRSNDRVCFEIDTHDEQLSNYASVVAEGRLVEVLELREKSYVKKQNDEKYNRLRRGFRPGHGRAGTLETLPLRKIVLERINGRKRSAEAGLPELAMQL